MLRGSWSEAYRAPNLVTINEQLVVRNNTRNDYTCIYAAENGGDPDQDTLDCRNSIQRRAIGSKDLKPEQSTNTSIGFVLTPTHNLTFTLDFSPWISGQSKKKIRLACSVKKTIPCLICFSGLKQALEIVMAFPVIRRLAGRIPGKMNP